MNNIIIENSYNSSYITIVLIALFYTNTYLEDMLLNRYLNNSKFIYLQELIKSEFITKLHQNQTIFSHSINKIRYLSYLLGWKSKDSLFQEHNIKDYYSFIIKNFDGLSYYKTQEHICFNIDAIDNSSIKEQLTNTIKSMFNSEIIYFNKLYPLITININRKHNEKMDIQKKILLNVSINNSNDIVKTKWIFHSAICFNGKIHYTLINLNKKWFIFSDNFLPSFISVDMSSPKTINKIKSEVIMVLYRLIYA